MGNVLYIVRKALDVIDDMTFGVFSPLFVPAKVVGYLYSRDVRNAAKYETDENGNIVFKRGRDYKEGKSA